MRLYMAQEQRRSPRVALTKPVVLAWSRKDGLRIREHGETTDVSAQGALVKMKSQVSVASEVTLNRPGVAQSNKAQVKRVAKDATEQSFKVGLELTTPVEDWES